MFKKTQLRLTLLYSLLFLVLFWAFSSGIYVWMNNSFGEGYVSQIQQHKEIDTDSLNRSAKIVTVAGDVALDQLRNILIVLNGVLLITIPAVSWFLAKKTLAPIQKAHEQQKQFVSDASHEMRTPLSIISGEIEVALKKHRSAGEYRSALVSTKEEADRLSGLVENLLFLAGSDKKSRSMKTEPVDITDLINSVVNALRPISRDKQITISLDTDDVSAPVVLGNPILLRQLFFNIIHNAVNYSSKKGCVTISLKETGSDTSIAVRDSGPGIAQKDQERIMERFYRVDASRSDKKGHGLGLAIAKVIIDAHRGNLRVDSALGKGSVFTIILPKK
jgi:signal transduction histidine kinase